MAIIGDNPFAFGEAGGVGAIWVRTLPGSAGTITVRAKHATLGTATTTIQIQQDAGATGQATPIQ